VAQASVVAPPPPPHLNPPPSLRAVASALQSNDVPKTDELPLQKTM